ncbi:sensor histidine kinase [Ottowia testudinis]|uniref:Histidine kinase n=1 Tax=Ottowia testudinis TaxID=2816950 RepID=A0A975H483_9BURK|nr:ATP-binding protein [Ottowia testudinis]QTD46051.1 histidine kinase [Ottowia testudinis]
MAWLAGCALPARADTPAPAHLTQAELWRSPSTGWAPPPMLAQADDGVLDASTPWQTVALPHARPRAVATTAAAAHAPPEVAWYRLRVPAEALAPTPQGPRLYIPRWQTSGTVAVYANGRLLWQTRGSRVWSSTNRPVWIDLGGTAPAGAPLTVIVRMASQQGVGGVLSSVWAGPAEALKLSWRVRTLLQADGVAFSRGSYLVIGIFALVLWLTRQRRGEWLYLLFFLMSVFQLLSMLHYMVDSEGFGIADPWFAWLAYVAGALGSELCAFYFLCAINQLRLPRLRAAMLFYVAGLTVFTLPPLGLLDLNSALPALRLALVPPGLVMIRTGVWGAIKRRTWGSALLAVWLLLALPMGLHDLALQSYRGDIESIYLTPYVYVGLFTMFLLIAYTRYVRALDVAAQANATLEQRLAERERELAASHQRLRAVEREQTLLAERQRLMRDMHDGVGASLMSALRLVEHGDAARIDVPQVLKECIDDLKISIDSLEPTDADLLALLASLRFRLSPRLEGAGLALRWAVQDVPPLPWLDAASALHVLRVLQEVITNIIKHSGARKIAVSTAESQRGDTPGVEVRIADDGHTFAPPPEPALPPGRKGLANIRARVGALGAHCDWAPCQNGGTVFALWLPLQRPRPTAAPA